MWGHDGGWGVGGMLAGTLLFLVFCGLVVVAVLAATRGAGRTAPPASPPPSAPGGDAARVLDDRLARGEIDVEEYRARRAALTER